MVKNCPLTSNQYGKRHFCMEEECAWWSEEAQECCIKSFFATDKKESEITSKKTSLFGEGIEIQPLKGGYHF